jgi:hypothetical protein
MIDGNLTTTNTLLAVIAAVSVLQALVLLAAAVLGYGLYRRTMQTLREIEERQIAPLAERVQMLIARLDAVLADVKDVTGRVTRGTERLNATASRMRASVRSRVSQVAGFMHALRSAAGHFRNGDRRTPESPTRSGV